MCNIFHDKVLVIRDTILDQRSNFIIYGNLIQNLHVVTP